MIGLNASKSNFCTHMNEIFFSTIYVYRNPFYGNIVNWTSSSWDVLNMVNYTLNYSHICSFPTIFLWNYPVILPFRLVLPAANTLCKSLNGYLNVISNYDNQQLAVSLMKNENEMNCKNGKFRSIDFKKLSDKIHSLPPQLTTWFMNAPLG